MSYLDMINFNESMLFEGEQAKAYKAKKAAEKDAKRISDEERESDYMDSARGIKDYKGPRSPKAAAEKDPERAAKAKKMVDKHAEKTKNTRLANNANMSNAMAQDAARRHLRKSNEAVELAESLLESYNPDCIFC